MSQVLWGTELVDIAENSVSGAVIYALGNNDSLTNTADNVTIFGGNGNDTLENHGGKNVKLYGDADNDVIMAVGSPFSSTIGKNVTINGGAGNDIILSSSNAGNFFEYNAGDGNDVIYGFNSKDTLSINSSNYSTLVNGDDLIVIVGSGAVSLKNSANISVKLKDSSGKVNVINQTPANVLTGTLSKDTIMNTNSNVMIYGFAGNDEIYNYASNVFISGNAGNDSIHSMGNKVSIYGGEDNGNDSIISVGDNAVIVGVGGNDIIYVGGNGNTVDGGQGNDTILCESTAGKNLIAYSSGGGNDVVYGFTAKDSLEIWYNTYSTLTSGNDIIVTVGDGKISLVGAASLSAVNISSKNTDTTPADTTTLTVTNSTKSPVTIGASVKNVDASTRTKALKITGNDLANSILGGSKNDTLYGGKGNDSILGNAGNDKIFGEVGNDLLWGGAGNDTITGGDGNDVFIYSAGKDVIADYATGDKISLGAAISKSSVKGSDVIFTIGSGSLTVKNGKGKTLNLIDKSGKSSTTILGGSDNSTLMTVTNSTKSPVTIGAAVKTVDASTRTTAVKITGNDAANTIIGGTGADTLYGGTGNDTINGGNGNDKLFGDAGADKLYGGIGNDTLTGGAGNDIFIYSAGKDVIADYATGDKISLGAAISKSSVKGSDVIFTIGSGSLTVKDGKGKTLNLIDSAGKSFTTILGGSDNSTLMTVTNSTKSPVTIGSAVKTVDASTRTTAVKITGNDLNNTIIGGTKNDTLYGGAGNDKLTGGSGKDVFIYGGGNDTVTDYATGDKISLNASIKSFGANGNDFVFKFNDGSLTLTDAASQKIFVTSGKVTNVYSADGISNTAGTAVTLNASAKTFAADSKIVTINAGLTSGATVTGNSKANKIWLGDGSDVVIWSKGGNDTLMNFGADDLLSITGAVTDGSISGGNTYLKIGSNKITVKDSAQVTFADDNGTKIFDNGIFYNADETSATIPASFKSNTKTPLELDAKKIDGSASKKSLNISATVSTSIIGSAKNDTISGSASGDELNGGKGNDSILGNAGNDKLYGEAGNDLLYGGAGNDTLTGGAGNDSLWGDAGADKFIYSKGDGKDVIYGFDDTDMLEITDTFSTSTNTKGTEIYFKVGSTSKAITLKDFGDTTTFNINGDIYQLSGKTLVKK